VTFEIFSQSRACVLLISVSIYLVWKNILTLISMIKIRIKTSKHAHAHSD